MNDKVHWNLLIEKDVLTDRQSIYSGNDLELLRANFWIQTQSSRKSTYIYVQVERLTRRFFILQFKTREANGLILYNAGRERDFIAVELVNGHIHYVFDLGDGPVRVRDTSRSRLNDGKWHAVSIGRPAPKRHTLAVDDHVTAVNSQGSNENLDLDGILYIGE